MKKNLTLSFCFLIALFSMLSCQHEEERTDIGQEEALSKSAPLTTLLKRVALDETFSSDDALDSSSCIRVKMPYSIFVHDFQGQLAIEYNQPVTNEQQLQQAIQIVSSLNDPQDDYTFVFPIAVVFPDGQEATIENQAALDLIRADCEFGYPNEQPIGCITINYPVTIFGYNANLQLASTSVIQSNQQLFSFLANLQPNQFYSIDFPISITNANGEVITITNNAELQAAITQNLCAPIDPCFNPQVLTSGLIVYMPFANEARDLVSETSVIHEPNYPPTFVADRSGNANSAVSFSGNSFDYYKILATDENNIKVSDSLSISVWFKMQNTNMGNLERFVEKSDGNFGGYGLGVYDLNKPFFYAQTTQFNLWDTDWGANPSLPTDTTNWHHLVITVSRNLSPTSVQNIVKLYRDGVLVSNGVTYDMFANTQAFDYYFGKGFQGHLDDLRIYRKVLSATDVQTLYNLEGDQNTCLHN